MVKRNSRVGTRRSKDGFSDRAVELFTQMLKLDEQCTCEELNKGRVYYEHEPCSACEAWWVAHNGLWAEVGAKAWEWPCVMSPEDAEGSEKALVGTPAAVARYNALMEAIG